MNILYLDPSPLNYISLVWDCISEPDLSDVNAEIWMMRLASVFNLDRLNYNNDLSRGVMGSLTSIRTDGGPAEWSDFYQCGALWRLPLWQARYWGLWVMICRRLTTPTSPNTCSDPCIAPRKLPNSKKARKTTQLKGTYKPQEVMVSPLNFNTSRFWTVTAGGQTLVEGVIIPLIINWGVQILDLLCKPNTPVNISVENNSMFGQQTKRFSGIDIQHKFSDDFQIGGTLWI